MKDNRTTMRINPSYMRIIDTLRKRESENMSRVHLINDYLKDIIHGNYDGLVPSKGGQKKPYLAVDKDLRQKANVHAKSLGFKNINEMIHCILDVKSEQIQNNDKGVKA